MMASRSEETVVVMKRILPPPRALSVGRRSRLNRARGHDLNARVVVLQDRVEGSARKRHAVRAVLTEPHAVPPPASQEHEFRFTLRARRLLDREEQFR